MVTNNFENRNLMQPMGRLSMHSKCFDFIFLILGEGGRGGWGKDFFSFFLCSQHVPFKFPTCSHQVPNLFPKGVPNSTSL
jgi:hypothetical protein